VLLLPGLVMRPDLHLLLLTETAKREEPSGPELLVLLVQANSETLLAILRVLQEKDSELVSQLANQRLMLLLVAKARQRDLFLHSAKLQEQQRQLEEGSAVPLGRAHLCSRCPGPCAFSQETPAARKCNRAARCGGYPTCARYRLLRNRRARLCRERLHLLSQPASARRAGTFPIAAADKCRCLLRRTAD
jgi:hypothetical protein